MIALGYSLALLVGLTLGLIGGGGSILSVPILYYVLDVPPADATAYSLFIVGVTSLVGTLTYAKRRLIDIPTGVMFALPAFVSIYITRLVVVPALPAVIVTIGSYTLTKSFLIMTTFALVMLGAGVAMICRKSPDEGGEQREKTPPRLRLIAFEGVLVGCLSGFVGAGGGFLIIPTLVVFAGLPMKKAVGTSLMIIAANSLIGFAGDLSAGRTIDWALLLGFVSLSLVGLVGGQQLSKVIPGRTLQPVFGWFVLVMGIGILVKESL